MLSKTLGSSYTSLGLRLALTSTLLLVLPPPPSLLVSASVTVYYQEGQRPLAASTSTSTGTGAAASYTGSAAYNPLMLQAPPPPGPSAMPTAFGIALQASVPPGASIPQTGGFFGFSIEMSVVNQVLGTNGSIIQVPFLNLMSNIQSRAGRIYIRVGGNTQETAVLVDRTSDGRILEKDLSNVTNPTATPPLIYTKELLYMLHNISSLVNVRWYLGVPFNDSSSFRLAIAEQGQQILGDFLVGLQAGNEPDLYGDHGHRPPTYGPYDYFGEFGVLVNAMNNDGSIPNRGLLIGPSVSTGKWTPEQIWDTGFVDAYSASLAYLSVEHYPTDNCYAQYGTGTPRDAQSLLPSYLTHTAGQSILAPYLNSTQYAQSKGKHLLMFETNTASCGGFAGISDAFAAALWGVDYALQMACANFSGALFHVGGQNVYYNPFTPPPTNQSTFRKWTVGPIYYAALVTAEALGPSNTTQVVDLQANNNNVYTPAYAIYEAAALQRVLLINFASDASGASDLQVSLSLPGTGAAASVQVKYLLAASVAQKGNFTWGGQTFGATFASDGRLAGAEAVQSASCTNDGSGSGAAACTIKVPAPGIALVFLTPDAQTEGKGGVPARAAGPGGTFSTSLVTRTRNTATVDAGVLATSNGHTGMDRVVGSTSREDSRVRSAAAWGGGVRGGGMGWIGMGGVGGVVVALGAGVVGGVVLVFGFGVV